MRVKRLIMAMILVSLVGVLAACFRQASDSFEPAGEALPGGALATEQASDADDGDTGDDAQATPTVRIQAITSTPFTFGDEQAAETPEAAETVAVPTTAPTDALPGSEAGGSETEPTTEITPIVPGLPSGPVVTNTPGPTATVDPSLPTDIPIITPTDLPETVGNDCIHVVVSGDTVFRIAQNNNTTVAAIVDVNPGLNPELINLGDEIILPNCEATSPDPVPNTGSSGAAPATEAVTEAGAAQPTAGAGTLPTAEPIIHIVSAGETLGRIATQYGVTVLQIVEANGLPNPNALSIGQELIIPAP